ncbi:MAG: O-antigen ligase family protein [Candidatus Eisenbacteria bacterium]|nr:O-antigen ligase family protein [Candidatus Eisenbacteria bacterium]
MTKDLEPPGSSVIGGGVEESRKTTIRRVLIAGVVAVECVSVLVLGLDGLTTSLLVLGGIGFAVLSLASPSAGWMMVVALVPFSQEISMPGTGSALQAPTEPMIFFLETLWILGLLQNPHFRLPPRRFTYSVIGVIAVPFVSCFYSDFGFATLKSTLNLAWYLFFGVFLAVSTLRSVKDLRRLTMVFTVPAAIVSLYYLQNVVRTGLGIKDVNAGALPFFGEHGTFAAYLCYAFPMAVLTTLWAKKKVTKTIFGCAACAVFAGILFSLTRAAWLAFAAMVGVTLILLPRSRAFPRWIFGVLAVGGIAAVVLAGSSQSTLFKHMRSIADTESNVSNMERLNRWAAAIDMFKAHPVVGVGFGAYKHHYRQFRRIRLATTESAPRAGAHNIFLSVLAEMGLVGAAVNLVFIGALLSLLSRNLSRSRCLGPESQPVTAFTLAIIAGLTGHGVHGLFNYYSSWDKVNVPLWTFIGAAAACSLILDSIESSNRSICGAP